MGKTSVRPGGDDRIKTGLGGPAATHFINHQSGNFIFRLPRLQMRFKSFKTVFGNGNSLFDQGNFMAVFNISQLDQYFQHGFKTNARRRGKLFNGRLLPQGQAFFLYRQRANLTFFADFN